MELLRGLCLLSFMLIFTHGTEDCPRRIDKNNNRVCKKKCQNGTCASPRKDCLCDGACGKSCILRNMKCTSLQKRITHGSVQIVPYNMFGAVARYSCDEGYEISGGARRVCQGDGQWSNEEPKCIVSSSEVTGNTECGPPPVINNAKHDREPWRMSYEQGVMLQYECDPGFTSNRGSIFRAWCVRSGWVGPNMTCSHAGCPLYNTTIHNGRIIPPIQITTGAILQYICNDGFFLAGREERECLADGTWGGREPSCEKVTCGSPPVIENAIIVGMETRGTFSFEQELTYACDQGYEMEGDPRAMCDTDGDWTWLGNPLQCTPINCGFPGNLVNGWQSGHLFFFGETVMYHCNDGYELIGQSTQTCEENGKWSGSLPNCIEKCGPPPTVEHAVILGQEAGGTFSFEQQLTYACEQGYDMEGDPRATCNMDGDWTWEGNRFLCRPVECPILLPPPNGTMVGSGNAFGTAIRFTCKAGLQLSGSVQRRCQADKTWSGDPAHCQEVNCRWPEPFYNGYVLGETTTVGSELFFSCNVRTNFKGVSLSTRCLETGEWSSPPPTCWGQCEVPTILNASLEKYREGEWVRSGLYLEYQCQNGLVPDVTNRVQCHNGTWSSMPRCVPSACPRPPPHVDYGLRVFDGLRHNSRAKYICRNGFRLRGMPSDNSFLTCKFGLWTGGRPVCEEFYCPNPGTIANGKIYKNGLRAIFDFRHYIKTIRHGDRILFKCKEGFVLEGPSGATCVNGQWRPPISDPDHKCKPATHAPFPKLWIPLEEMPKT
ncbi:protein lev-9-like [Argopecten irradians]|uniref:protein lev-9-like n=1 Tax=Argopecten irradians TaxID=31199 RepID=UPI0037146090